MMLRRPVECTSSISLSPGLLAMSIVAAARWRHDVAFHGVELSSLQAVAAGLVIGLGALGLAPVLTFAGVLRRTRAQAVREYGTLAGEHGRRVHRKWIEREPLDHPDGLLSAPELGPAADVASLYDAVTRMRRVPIDATSLQAVLLPAVLPLLAVAAIRIPVRDIAKAVLQAIL